MVSTHIWNMIYNRGWLVWSEVFVGALRAAVGMYAFLGTIMDGALLVPACQCHSNSEFVHVFECSAQGTRASTAASIGCLTVCWCIEDYLVQPSHPAHGPPLTNSLPCHTYCGFQLRLHDANAEEIPRVNPFTCHVSSQTGHKSASVPAIAMLSFGQSANKPYCRSMVYHRCSSHSCRRCSVAVMCYFWCH